MIMNAKPLQRGICGDTNARGRSRSPLLELHMQSIFDGLKKKSTERFCRLRRQTAPGV